MSRLNPTENDCVKVRSLLDSYAAGEHSEELEVRAHLEGCRACKAAATERERLRALVRRAVRSEPAPEGLRARIQELMRADAR